MKYVLGTAAVAAAMALTAPAYATTIPAGTVSVVALHVPSVDLSTSPASYTAAGWTWQVAGTGGFGDVANFLGQMNGTVSFSKTVGVTVAQTLTDFFVFNDGHGGTYNFSADSVQTLSYLVKPGKSVIALSFLGTTLDGNLGYDPTATELLGDACRALGILAEIDPAAVVTSGAVPRLIELMMQAKDNSLLLQILRKQKEQNITLRW